MMNEQKVKKMRDECLKYYVVPRLEPFWRTGSMIVEHVERSELKKILDNSLGLVYNACKGGDILVLFKELVGYPLHSYIPLPDEIATNECMIFATVLKPILSTEEPTIAFYIARYYKKEGEEE